MPIPAPDIRKCPRCRKDRNNKGFRQNPDINFNNQVCWKCWRQLKYLTEQNYKSNIVGLTVAKAKQLILDHYGRFCSCCGEDEEIFLELDHINNDGAEHKKKLGRLHIYIWLVNSNFPVGFRLLCSNCNAGRYRNGGICPHKNKRMKLVS